MTVVTGVPSLTRARATDGVLVVAPGDMPCWS